MSNSSDFAYTFLVYLSKPELEESASRTVIGVLGFPRNHDCAARLWLQKGRFRAVAEFGYGADQPVIKDCLLALLELISANPVTTEVIHRVDSMLAREGGVLRCSEVRPICVPSLRDIPSKLGIDVDESANELLSSWQEGCD